MTAMFDQDVTALCEPDSKRNAGRGRCSEAGSVNLKSSDNALSYIAQLVSGSALAKYMIGTLPSLPSD